MSADPNAIPITLQELNIDQIEPNERNPRLVFPQDELDRLAESIDRDGILVPIVVYPKDGKYVLVDGERRFRCALTLGLPRVPAVITTEMSDLELLQQMFNIHLIREPWQDMPTARALQDLAEKLAKTTGRDPSDDELRIQTGLSLERVRRLRYVVTLPKEWQDYIQAGKIPLNFFWELKRGVIDPLARMRHELLDELDADQVMNAFVEKRLKGVITDTVSLRKVTDIIRLSAKAANEGGETAEELDNSIRGLVNNPTTTIDEVYEETIQIMVEVDRLERRSASMAAAFSRLMFTSVTVEDRAKVKSIAERLIRQLELLIGNGSGQDEQAN